jgi:GxxExxY protein
LDHQLGIPGETKQLSSAPSGLGVAMASQEQLVEQIRQGCVAVAKTLGPGFTKEIYGNAIALELEKMEMLVARCPSFDIYYGEIKVGGAQPDLIVEGAMMIQLKVGQAIEEADRAEAIHNLKAADLADGLLVNFGRAGVEIQQIKHSPQSKPTRA